MERKRLEKESEADTPLPDIRRATSLAARASHRRKDGTRERESPIHPQDADEKRSWWTGAALAMNLPGKMPDVLKRYGLALVLAGLALFVRWIFPSRQAPPSISFPSRQCS